VRVVQRLQPPADLQETMGQIQRFQPQLHEVVLLQTIQGLEMQEPPVEQVEMEMLVALAEPMEMVADLQTVVQVQAVEQVEREMS
jgi:Flp pilus assembly CpaE family ATPase